MYNRRRNKLSSKKRKVSGYYKRTSPIYVPENAFEEGIRQLAFFCSYGLHITSYYRIIKVLRKYKMDIPLNIARASIIECSNHPETYSINYTLEMFKKIITPKIRQLNVKKILNNYEN